MLVSVIIPVYNAVGFVTQAVESALEQPETGEVILVEDDKLAKIIERSLEIFDNTMKDLGAGLDDLELQDEDSDKKDDKEDEAKN
mgnify:CR=1 FL=1